MKSENVHPEAANSEPPTPSNFQQEDSDDEQLRMEMDNFGILPAKVSRIEDYNSNGGKNSNETGNRRRVSPNIQRNAEPKSRIKEQSYPRNEPSHFQFLKDEFTKRFGLPTVSGKRRRIRSFVGVLIAEGYEKVVTTWQGMHFHTVGRMSCLRTCAKLALKKATKLYTEHKV